jgi:hypothetical protein
MTRLHIDRIAMKLHGVPVQIAEAALSGLDSELLRRLQRHGIDPAALAGLPSTLRLPPIHSLLPLDADALRARVADGLMALLMPASTLDVRATSADTAEETA